ncbi:MAG: hypothetical protein H6737_18025 [Alphaproteobacteria bacterium]|nr:hypothetical protein [Alphaproteobacteria bacterium]
MFAPSLRNATLGFEAPSTLPVGIRVFGIVRDGEFAGRHYRSGELAVVVGGVPEEGDAVVLVAVGPGRPRLGRVQGNRLIGDRGEPCLMSRWEVAGRVEGVIRPVGAGWAIEMFDQPGIVGMAADRAPGVLEGTPEPVRPVAQLSLFAA